MTPSEQAQATIFLEQKIRDVMHHCVRLAAKSDAEEIVLTTGILTLLLRHFVKDQGQEILETMLKQVLQP